MRIPRVLKSVRYSLAAVNSLFLITGFVLLTVGIIVLITHKKYDLLLTGKFITLPGFAIGTAAVIFLTVILGYYGAVSEHFYFIVGYVALLIVVLVFEISITVMGFKLQDNAFNEIRSPMSQSLQQYTKRRSETVAWDNLQLGFECCGVAGLNDWNAIGIPVSCCVIPVGTVSPFECTNLNANTGGCQSVLSVWLGYNAYVIGVTAAFVTCLQVLIIAASAWLAYRSKYEEVELEQ